MAASSVRVGRIVQLVDELGADERAELEARLLADLWARGRREDAVLDAETLGGQPRQESIEHRLGVIAQRVVSAQSSETATLSVEDVERGLRADLDF